MSNNNQNAAPTNGQRISIDQAIQHASKLNQVGRLQEAHALLTQVIKNAPKNVVALQQMSGVLHKAGKTADAITFIEKAIKIRKNEAAFLSMAGEMYRSIKNLDKAVEYGKKAVALKPKVPAFLGNLGAAYSDQGELNLAQKYHTKALAIDPHYVSSLNNLGALLTEQRQPEAAIPILAKAINLNPRLAVAHCNIGFALLAMEQSEKAKLGFDEAILLDPNMTKAVQGLASYHLEKKQYDVAKNIIQEELKKKPQDKELHRILGNIYRGAEDIESALKCFDESLTINPLFVSAMVAKGELLIEIGQIEEATDLLSQAISLDNSNVTAHLALAGLVKTKPEDLNFQWLVNEAKTLDPQSETKALPIHFALGKCYDDIKQYDKAFEHYKKGCAIKRKRISYQADDNTALTENIIRTFSTNKLNKLKGTGCTSNTPIFILGMPRSGTTLTEQIIASHPSVFGAGELSDLSHLLNGRNDETVIGGYPESVKDFTDKHFRQLGERYATQLQERDPTAAHITDKMPANFMYLGPIHIALPNAKIVHVKRNPVDTCLSQFSKTFKRGQHFSYDLYELGRHYRDYHNLMAHWRKVLPVGSFYEVQYEDLVADTEIQARALIDYCGLEWNDDCLNFHKSARSVRTASVTQVRQPIYKTSVERWRSYEKHLSPLFEGLGDLAPKR